MQLISLDLELNQPSRKIIQLGYVIFNVKNWKILQARSLFINPNEPVAPEITQLTGIDDSMVTTGMTLNQAYETMIEDMKKHQVTHHPVQWGTDHIEIRSQLEIPWSDFIFKVRDHDIKSLFQLLQAPLPNSKTVAGLGKAISILGGQWDYKYGNPHDALADAYNTMLIYKMLANKMVTYEKMMKALK